MSQGVLFGDYLLLGRLNRGGMAEVFLARRPDTAGQLLALKRTLPEFSKDKDFVSMFTDEARIARGLVHPNICQIYDQGEFDKQLFIVLEFIHGKDLKVITHRARQRNEMMPYRYVAFALSRIADALHLAHEKKNSRGEPEGIVHRDVSPQNILLSYDGVPKLIDFGIAKAKDRIAHTQVGVLKGKFAYMSPEQATGKFVDRRTDIFALGVVLYELVTAKSAFKGQSDFSTLQRIAQGHYVSPEQLNPDVPRSLAAIIRKALDRDAEARYQTGAELARALEAFVAEDPRPVNEATLATYMRKLFREDYARESSRIKSYLSDDITKPSGGVPAPPQKAPPVEPTHTDIEPIEDATGVAPSFHAELDVVDKADADSTPDGTPHPRLPAAARDGSDPGRRKSDWDAATQEVAVPSFILMQPPKELIPKPPPPPPPPPDAASEVELSLDDLEVAPKEAPQSSARFAPNPSAKTEIFLGEEKPPGFASQPTEMHVPQVKLEPAKKATTGKKAAPAAAPAPVKKPRPPGEKSKTKRAPLPAKKKRGAFSRTEIAVLVAAAAIGAAVVGTTYYYLAFKPQQPVPVRMTPSSEP